MKKLFLLLCIVNFGITTTAVAEDKMLNMALATSAGNQDVANFFEKLKGRYLYDVAKERSGEENLQVEYTLTSVYKDAEGMCINQTLTLNLTDDFGYIEGLSTTYSDDPESKFACE